MDAPQYATRQGCLTKDHEATTREHHLETARDPAGNHQQDNQHARTRLLRPENSSQKDAAIHDVHHQTNIGPFTKKPKANCPGIRPDKGAGDHWA